MKKEDVGYIVPSIYYTYKYSRRLPKKFISTAIQKYGTIGDKLLCKFMFERTCFRQFSLAKLFWEFSRFDPCNDKMILKYPENRGIIYPHTVRYMFALDDKTCNEMRNFMWKINNINFSADQYQQIKFIFEEKIDNNRTTSENDRKIPIFREIISILDAKIVELN
jgi:hypothetical protein